MRTLVDWINCRETVRKKLKNNSPTAQTALFANHQMGNFAVLAFPKFVHGQSVRRNSKKQRNERNACSNPNLGFDSQINENDTLIIDKTNLLLSASNNKGLQNPKVVARLFIEV